VTVEEIVDDLNASPNACVLPGWIISAVCLAPGGAYPSYAQGYYDRDNQFYQSWDKISRSRDDFLSWMELNVMKRPNHDPQLAGHTR
jgi:glutaconate CoA-transferase subunit A